MPSSAGSISEDHDYVYGFEGTDVSEAKASTSYMAHGVLYNWAAAMPSGPNWTCR
jgi:hypothetical protein